MDDSVLTEVADGVAVMTINRPGRVAANGPLAIRVTKQIVSGAVRWTDAEAFREQATLVDPVFRSADAQEGAGAFAEKRKPVWRGE